jgi:hypothetical protein
MLSLSKTQKFLLGSALFIALVPIFADAAYAVALEVWCLAYGLLY